MKYPVPTVLAALVLVALAVYISRDPIPKRTAVTFSVRVGAYQDVPIKDYSPSLVYMGERYSNSIRQFKMLLAQRQEPVPTEIVTYTRATTNALGEVDIHVSARTETLQAVYVNGKQAGVPVPQGN